MARTTELVRAVLRSPHLPTTKADALPSEEFISEDENELLLANGHSYDPSGPGVTLRKPHYSSSSTPLTSLVPRLVLVILGVATLSFLYSLFPSSSRIRKSAFDVSSLPIPTLPSNAIPVCSVEGQQLWSTHSSDPQTPSSHSAPSHWSFLNAFPSITENPFNWNFSSQSFTPFDLETSRRVSIGVADFLDKLINNFLLEPAFAAPPGHPWHNLPPFPFPSVSRTLPEATRHPFSIGLRDVPHQTNKSAPEYVEGGARIPFNYTAYTTDAELLYAAWPHCFEAKGGRDFPTMDVADFLRLYHQYDGNETYQAALLHPVHLNTLALSLNMDKFPYDQYPPPGVDSIPLVVTTIDTEENRQNLPQFAANMRRIIGIHDSTVFINYEKVKAETLALLVENVDFARVLLYFTPIEECTVHKPYQSQIGKDWKINVSLLFIFHIVYNVWDFDYAVVVEDDMDPSRDMYLFHLAVSPFATTSPDVFTVAGSSYSRYYDCYHMPLHFSGQFFQPNFSHSIPCPSDGQIITESDLIAFNFTTSHLLAMERVIIPWACGYTRKYYAFLLNFFLTWTGTLGWQRYDISAHRIFGGHPYMRALVPMTGRVHGDPVFLHGGRKRLPLLTACQHSHWEVVAPAPYKQQFDNPRMSYYDFLLPDSAE